MFLCNIWKKNLVSAQMPEASLIGVETVLRLERDAWPLVKRLRQATTEYASPPRPSPNNTRTLLEWWLGHTAFDVFYTLCYASYADNADHATFYVFYIPSYLGTWYMLNLTSHTYFRRLQLILLGNVIINTSYQKLPFGSGDDPDKLFFHQALN